MSFRRIPKEIDPRRPPKRRESKQNDGEGAAEPRSYGQYIDVSRDELEEIERVTDEVAREGSGADIEPPASAGKPGRRALEEREEFEDATDEVSREGNESNG